MSEPTREPEVIAAMRCARDTAVSFKGKEYQSFYSTFSVRDILAAYDQVVAERDAAVRERDMWQRRALSRIALQAECDTLRARLAACEKIVEAAEDIAGNWNNMARRVVLVDALRRAAVAAETQGEKEEHAALSASADADTASMGKFMREMFGKHPNATRADDTREEK